MALESQSNQTPKIVASEGCKKAQMGGRVNDLSHTRLSEIMAWGAWQQPFGLKTEDKCEPKKSDFIGPKFNFLYLTASIVSSK